MISRNSVRRGKVTPLNGTIERLLRRQLCSNVDFDQWRELDRIQLQFRDEFDREHWQRPCSRRPRHPHPSEEGINDSGVPRTQAKALRGYVPQLDDPRPIRLSISEQTYRNLWAP
jgi:hypothetical protein